jgi:heme/copper-type cytochrome/quinol oxidase subunit 2
VSLPPLFFYAIGTILVVVGALRFFLLGRRRADRELTEDTPQRAKVRRYHAIWGVVFMLVGAFLIASTAGILGRR